MQCDSVSNMVRESPHLPKSAFVPLSLMMYTVYFHGFARIPLDEINLNLPEFIIKHRHENTKNVDRLINLFKSVGCHQAEPRHAISALISQDQLRLALDSLGLTELPKTPSLDVNTVPLLRPHLVYCLHGLHRVQAAKAFLEDPDRWWTVRLYSSGNFDPAENGWKVLNR